MNIFTIISYRQPILLNIIKSDCKFKIYFITVFYRINYNFFELNNEEIYQMYKCIIICICVHL